MDHGKSIFGKKYILTKREIVTPRTIITCIQLQIVFNVYFTDFNCLLKVYNSAFNGKAENFSKDYKNGKFNAGFQFRKCPYSSSISKVN